MFQYSSNTQADYELPEKGRHFHERNALITLSVTATYMNQQRASSSDCKARPA